MLRMTSGVGLFRFAPNEDCHAPRSYAALRRARNDKREIAGNDIALAYRCGERSENSEQNEKLILLAALIILGSPWWYNDKGWKGRRCSMRHSLVVG